MSKFSSKPHGLKSLFWPVLRKNRKMCLILYRNYQKKWKNVIITSLKNPHTFFKIHPPFFCCWTRPSRVVNFPHFSFPAGMRDWVWISRGKCGKRGKYKICLKWRKKHFKNILNKISKCISGGMVHFWHIYVNFKLSFDKTFSQDNMSSRFSAKNIFLNHSIWNLITLESHRRTKIMRYIFWFCFICLFW